MRRCFGSVLFVAAVLCAVAEETVRDGTFYPTSDWALYKSFYDPTYWSDSIVATGVGARVTMRSDKLIRFVLDCDGWTVGHLYHDNGDFYLYSSKDDAGTAWLHLDAGAGGVSEVNFAGGGWKALYKTHYHSPTKFLGSNIQFYNEGYFEEGAYPILQPAGDYCFASDHLPNHDLTTTMRDGARGAGLISLNGIIPQATANGSRRLDYTSTYPFGGSFNVDSGFITFRPTAWTVETAVAVPSALPSGCVLHLDASAADSFVYGDGTTVTTWKDLSGSGNDATSAGAFPPDRLEREIGEKAVVTFPGYEENTTTERAYMTFAQPVTTGGKTLFWVVGSQNGGGSLLANASSSARCYQRGGTGGTVNDDPIFAAARAGVTVRLNGAAVDPVTTGLSGGFDIVAMTDENTGGNAFTGLACDVVGTAAKANGHQELAEFLVFDRVLTEAETKGVEAYLADKWFKGRTDMYRNMILTREYLTVTESDRTVTVQELQGSGTLVKDGAGTLRIEKPSKFGGTIELKEGALELGAADVRPRYTGTPALPTEGMIFHLDASDAASLDLTNGFVAAWRDTDGRLDEDGAVIVGLATNAVAKAAPYYNPIAINGHPGIDFGVPNKGGRALSFSKRITGGRTLMVVDNSRNGGGYYIAASDACFADRGTSLSQISVWGGPLSRFWWNREITAYLDGRRVDPRLTHPYGAPETVTFETRGDFTVNQIGLDRAFTDRQGGQLFGEYIIWNRRLTEDERRSAEAYLYDKWLANRPALRALRVTGTATLVADEDVTVEGIEGTGTLIKEGAGTLTIVSSGLAFDRRNVKIRAGKVVFKADRGDAPMELPVANPAIWTDASAAGTLTVTSETCTWTDVRKNGWVATAASGTDLSVRENELNGRAVLDAGHTGCKCFTWPEAHRTMRTIFIVKGSHPYVNNQNGGCLLRCSDNANAWKRTCYSKAYANFILDPDTTQPVGRFWLNGTACSPHTTGYDGGYQMVTVEAGRQNLYADAFANGQQIAEFIAYDRFLTDAERRSVEAYLARKWFAQGLHGYTVPGQIHYAGYDTTGKDALTVTLGANETNTVGWVTGTGAIVKDGDGVLAIGGATAGFGGTLDIRSGGVVYTAPKYAGTPPAIGGLIARFDADASDTITTYGDGSGVVHTWTDASGTHVATNKYYLSRGRDHLKVMDGDCNGHDTLVFGTYGKGSAMELTTPLTGVSTVFALLGTHESTGAFIEDTGANWHPGYLNGWGSVTSGIFHNDIAKWLYLDGAGPYKSDTTNILSAATYHVVSVQRKDSGTAPVHMFGSDRFLDGRDGGFRIGELLFYATELTDRQREEVEAYLSYKWQAKPVSNFNYMVANSAHAGSLTVAAGASFDLNGFTQTVGALAGGGSVLGDLTLESGATWTIAAGTAFTVTGTLTLSETGTLAFADGVVLKPGRHKIAGASSVVAPADLKGWRTAVGTAKGAVKVSLEVVDNVVYAVVAGRGLTLIVR